MSISIAQKYIDGMRQGLGVDLSVEVYPSSGRSFKLTKSNIVQGTFVIDRTVCSGDVLEIGSAIAAELSFTMKNEPFTDPDGESVTPADVIFEGANLIVNLTLHNPSDSETVVLPLGIFVVDEQPRKLSTISIKALDYMMRFDISHDGAVGSSLLVVVQHCCDLARVTLSSSAITFLNGFAGVYTLPEAIADKEDLVCRQVLMWVGEMTASCAYIDENGYLDFKQYPQTHLGAMVITEADRYSSDMQESDITITGITVTPTDSESEAVTIGAQGYEWNIEGNQLLVSPDEMASAPLGYSDKKFFAYRPFTASTKSFPHLWPLDAIVFSKTTNGVTEVHNSVITHHTWKLNGSSSISAVGKTATKNGYATHGGFTAKQKAVLERAVKGQVKTQMSGYQNALININKQALGALGLYSTTDKDTGITYYHNQPAIDDSTYIYMESTAGRFMATGANAWNDGDPVWTGGWTSLGEIVAQSLAAGSITTDMLTVGYAANAEYNLMTAGDFYNPNTGGTGWNRDGTFEDFGADSSLFPPVGKKAARVLTGEKTDMYCSLRNIFRIDIIAGQKYTLSFYIKRSVEEVNASLSVNKWRYMRMVIDWYSNTDDYIKSNSVDSVGSENSVDWERFSGIVTAPSNSAKAEIKFFVDNYSEFDRQSEIRNSYIYLAGVMLNAGEKLPTWNNKSWVSSNVIIDKTGIDVYNGAIKIYGSDGKLAFGADEKGNLSITGTLKTLSESDKYAELTYGGLHFFKGDTEYEHIELIEWQNINDQNKTNLSLKKDLIIGEGSIYTGYSGAYNGTYDVFAGLRHYRPVSNTSYSCGFGIGKAENNSIGVASIELRRPSTTEKHTPHYDYICARLDIRESPYSDSTIGLRGRTSYGGDTYSPWLYLGTSVLDWNGKDMLIDGISFVTFYNDFIDLTERVEALESN